MQINELYQLFIKHPNICTDTRKITPNCIFFALKGENFDGNKFVHQAIENGASYAIVSNENINHKNCIYVNDTLETLQKLAKYHRQQLKIPVIGITGTNGKTTTKELIYSILKEKYNILATSGNFNNHIGVPLTLLRINNTHEIAIIEMGANHKNEIGFLCNIALPEYGIITNIGKAHLEGFGSYQGVIETKNELYTHIKENHGTLFVNADDELLISLSKNIKSITYGSENSAAFNAVLINIFPFLEIQFKKSECSYNIKSNLIGKYNFYNILAACCIGDYFNLTGDEIKKGIETYIPTNNRSQIVETKNNTIILDAYNANPSSMKVALESLKENSNPNKFIVLGDMLELGNVSKEEHQNIISILKQYNLRGVLIGKEFSELKPEKNLVSFQNTDGAREYLKENTPINALILIKGSRGIKLETLVEIL